MRSLSVGLVLTFAALVSSLLARAQWTVPSEVDLAGLWQLTNSAGNVSSFAMVPGEVHTDLVREGVLKEDPYFRYNDIEFRWIVWQDWTFTRTVELPAAFAGSDKIVLDCEGIDTVAIVRVNGLVVGTTDNMFRHYQFDVASALVAGTNTIQVEIKSPATYVVDAMAAYPYALPESTEPSNSHGILGRNYVRKEQCSASGDPSSSLPGRALSFLAEVKPVEVGWSIKTTFNVESSFANAQQATLRLDLDGTDLTTPQQVVIPPGASSVVVDVSVPAASVALWWPVGYGNQPLYTITATLSFAALGADAVVAEQRRVGFRTMELVQEPYEDQIGESFYFRINGVPIWSKGSNWIPVDAFESRVTDDVIRNLLDSVLAANMNTVRVWGGGLYPQSSFYEYCDEKGILVWEEFMFACALYPTDSKFLATVRAEVIDQVSRLIHHPSIILWSGNNENEQAITQNWFTVTRTDPYTYAVDYDRLYHTTIRNTLLTLDSSRPFLSSSPANGVWSVDPFAERWIAPNGDTSTSEFWGDAHTYNYLDDCEDITKMVDPRFSSEYGFQAMPSFFSIEQISLPEDWAWNSEFLKFRNHRTGDGQSEIAQQLQIHFKFPSSSDSLTHFLHFIYLSQVNQGICYKAQTEHYRVSKTMPANTYGALYWQLNDIWQAPTWSSIEYGGRWKLLHHFAADFFAPVLVSSLRPSPTSDVYQIHVTSDINEPITGSVNLSVWSWASGGALVDQYTLPFSLDALGSKSIYESSLDRLVNGAPADCFFVLDLATASNGTQYTSQNYFFPTKPRNMANIPLASLSVSSRQLGPLSAEVTIRTDTIALFVSMETAVSGRFLDNAFHLLPGTERTVAFEAWWDEPIDWALFVDSLRVLSLSDTF